MNRRQLEAAVSFLLVEMAVGLVRGSSVLRSESALMLCSVPCPAPAQTSVKCATHTRVWCLGARRGRVRPAGDQGDSSSLGGRGTSTEGWKRLEAGEQRALGVLGG